MLVELMVENYAVVERLRVRFHRGLNVLTGETGSGKSLVVDALGLLFGGRASVDMIRSGEERARVSGIFETPPALVPVLDEAGIQLEEGELLVEREILANGKSRAFAGNRPVTAALLRNLAAGLGDIHGQHDQQQLFLPEAQLVLLDGFSANQELLGQISQIYRLWRQCAKQIEEIERGEQEKLRLLDLWTFQRKEIESAQLKSGEDAALESERRVLQNVGRLLESANVAYEALYDAPESVYAQMRVSLRRIEELCRIDESLQSVQDLLKPAQIAVEEASSTLRDYLGRLEADPDRLEEVESRLAGIDKLKRKYGAGTDEILAFLANVLSQIESVESSTDRKTALEKEREELRGRYESLAAKLTERRREFAARLSKLVQTELKSLAMERTIFEIRLQPAAWSESGADAITFLVSPNIGEEPRPLEKVASGGELSRIALALKTCTTGAADKADGAVRTLVFDEVDAGIGGIAAEAVGRRLKHLASESQVLCVTHLAQIAGFGDHHYSVAKQEAKGRTVASIQELSGEARTREIGRMLSGQRLTPEALKHAEQLIRMSAG